MGCQILCVSKIEFWVNCILRHNFDPNYNYNIPNVLTCCNWIHPNISSNRKLDMDFFSFHVDFSSFKQFIEQLQGLSNYVFDSWWILELIGKDDSVEEVREHWWSLEEEICREKVPTKLDWRAGDVTRKMNWGLEIVRWNAWTDYFFPFSFLNWLKQIKFIKSFPLWDDFPNSIRYSTYRDNKL